MAFSDDLARLSVRAKQAEDRAAAAKSQAHDQLQQAVQEARDGAQQTASKLRADTSAAADRADDWADNMQRSWDEHLARTRQRIDARKAQHAADRAESDAEDAEAYAAYSIDLAYSAIEEAEYASLDAVLARRDADEAAGALAT
jgi:hypothetical protein